MTISSLIPSHRRFLLCWRVSSQARGACGCCQCVGPKARAAPVRRKSVPPVRSTTSKSFPLKPQIRTVKLWRCCQPVFDGDYTTGEDNKGVEAL
jgi:hypothetical protein